MRPNILTDEAEPALLDGDDNDIDAADVSAARCDRDREATRWREGGGGGGNRCIMHVS